MKTVMFSLKVADCFQRSGQHALALQGLLWCVAAASARVHGIPAQAAGAAPAAASGPAEPVPTATAGGGGSPGPFLENGNRRMFSMLCLRFRNICYLVQLMLSCVQHKLSCVQHSFLQFS